MRILWIDDDAKGLLRPVHLLLERECGESIVVHETYRKGMDHLIERQYPDNLRVDSILVDVILPKSDGNEALSAYLGLTLADRAPAFGVKIISFLTVVAQDEVREQYQQLEKDHPNVRFSYWNKLSLLSPGQLEGIASELTTEEEPPRVGGDGDASGADL